MNIYSIIYTHTYIYKLLILILFISYSLINYLRKPAELQKNCILALCLQRPVKMMGFSFLLTLRLCWIHHMFQREQRHGV